jgi:antitoxin VapB
MGMIDLSQETEALAKRLAAAKRLSVEATIRQALEAHARASGITPQAQRRRDASPEAVAARIARFDAFAQRIAVAPINDPRPVSEIVDDLNAL